MSAARRLVDRYPFPLALAVIGLLYVGPAWVFTHPPMDDYPAHLAMSQQLSEVLAGDPGPWRLMSMPWPNWMFAAVHALLSAILPPLFAGRLLVSLAIIATPYCLSLILRRFDLPPWGALIALPILVPLVNFGLIPFVTSVPLALLGISLAPTIDNPKRAAGFAVLGIITYWAHAGGFVLLGPAALVTAFVANKDHPRRAFFWTGAGYAIPVATCFIPWALTRTIQYQSEHSAGVAPWMHPFRLLDRILLYEGWLVSPWEYRTLVLSLVVFAAAIALPRMARPTWRRCAPAASVALMALALPGDVDAATSLGERLLMVSAMLATLMLPLSTATPAGRAHLAVWLVALGLNATARYGPSAEYDAIAKKTKVMVEAIPAKTNVALTLSEQASLQADTMRPWRFLQLASWMYLWQGTYSNVMPSTFATSVVQAKKDALHRLIGPNPGPVNWFELAGGDPRLPYVLSASPYEAPTRGGLGFDPSFRFPGGTWLAKNDPTPDKLGPYAPIWAYRDLTLYRNRRARTKPWSPPDVDDVCEDNGDTIACDHRLRHRDAAASCKAWGGKLVAGAEGTTHWLPQDTDQSPQRRCAAATQSRLRVADCDQRAFPLCEVGTSTAPRDAAVFQVDGRAHFVIEAPMNQADASRRCAATGAKLGRPKNTHQAAILVATSHRAPLWLDLVHDGEVWTRAARGAPQAVAWTPEGLTIERARTCPAAVEGKPASLFCDRLLPFTCGGRGE